MHAAGLRTTTRRQLRSSHLLRSSDVISTPFRDPRPRTPPAAARASAALTAVSVAPLIVARRTKTRDLPSNQSQVPLLLLHATLSSLRRPASDGNAGLRRETIAQSQRSASEPIARSAPSSELATAVVGSRQKNATEWGELALSSDAEVVTAEHRPCRSCRFFLNRQA